MKIADQLPVAEPMFDALEEVCIIFFENRPSQQTLKMKEKKKIN